MNLLYSQIKSFIDISKPILINIKEEYNIDDNLIELYLKDFENALKDFRKQKRKSNYNIFCKNNRQKIKEKYKDILDNIQENDEMYKTKSEKSKAKFSFITKKLSEEWKIHKANVKYNL